MYAYKDGDDRQQGGNMQPSMFLNKFIGSPDIDDEDCEVPGDEIANRQLTPCDVGELGNQNHDVPLQDMYNRGLSLTKEQCPRVNLALEGNRPGVTGFIPSMEQAYQYPGTLPMGQKLMTSLPMMNQLR